MSDAMPAKPNETRGVSGLVIFLLTVAWFGGTTAFFMAAVAETFGVDCQIRPHNCVLSDRFLLASVACACGFPLLAALICGLTDRGLGTVIFVVLGVAMALVYGMTLGVDAAKDIHRFDPPTSVPVPSNTCQCHSGGSCHCPGG